jgi:hypothetical protein
VVATVSSGEIALAVFASGFLLLALAFAIDWRQWGSTAGNLWWVSGGRYWAGSPSPRDGRWIMTAIVGVIGVLAALTATIALLG